MASTLLSNQVVQLHRQVEQYREVCTYHHRLLADVTAMLDGYVGEEEAAGRNAARIVDMQRRVQNLMGKQAHLLNHRFFDPESGEWNPTNDAADRLERLKEKEAMRPLDEREDDVPPMLSRTAVPSSSSGPNTSGRQTLKQASSEGGQKLMEKAADQCGSKLQTATARLLTLWFNHLGAKVTRSLASPQEKFEVFHEQPTEETLAEFMDSFQETRREITEMLEPSPLPDVDSSQHSGDSLVLGPKGNPFEMDGRLLKLYQVTVKETIDEVCAELDATQGASSASGGPATKNDKPGVGNYSTPGRSNPQPKRGTPDGPLARQRQQQPLAAPKREVPPSQTSPQQASTSRAPSHEQQQHPGAGAPRGAQLPRVAPLDTKRLQQDSGARYAPQRVSTPGRHSRNIQDSSQMKDMLGGGVGSGSGLSSARSSRPSTPSLGPIGGSEEPSGPPPTKLEQLQGVLHQLEMQLSGIAMSGRDTGSEAKYYALTKKLQKVRAEVLKEQREEDELRQAHEGMEANRMVREEHRRVFRR